MRANVLIVGKSSELRVYITHALGNAGWETLIFSDGRSAFLYTCRNLTTVAAAVIDDAPVKAAVDSVPHALAGEEGVWIPEVDRALPVERRARPVRRAGRPIGGR